MIQCGYVDALQYLGWKVYVGDPKTKLGCRKIIENHKIGLIMTHSRYGIRQLPVDVINANQILVFIEALPLNAAGITVDDPYEFAHEDEPNVIQAIKSVIVHTRLEPHIWNLYMQIWNDYDINLVHNPVAGNMIRALPPTFTLLTDVAMVANFAHRQGIMHQLIEPLFKRLDLLGYSYQAFGDDIWARAGLNYNGPLVGDVDKLAHVYATARVCPNVHTGQQIKLQACVNERSFMIPLCGGIQISDNPLISKYLKSHCEVANSVTNFMNKVIELIDNKQHRFDTIRTNVEYVANNHTYFNRLVDLFRQIGLHQYAIDIEAKSKRAAARHCWAIDARLSTEERGVSYEQETIKTT
jgi:hypothetical protein